ncbi:MAG: type II toxin-antitoxin system VapC family toxin [Verrucomicrobia bacterium]|jgi:tRNA(fMet)-specific endonuclease VapC|nr:type II toxin-antitoxin system VapC family toxin [Verrucomicrobiota bacterium]
MITHMFDTNICIFLIRQKSLSVRSRIESCHFGQLSISSITESELRHGASKSSNPSKNHSAIDRMLISLKVMPYDSSAASHYGKIRAELERIGKIISAMDLLIAAHADSLGLRLVTNNTKEFSRVEGLILEDWT